MKISKAIELNEESEKSLRSGKFPDHADAIKLGIEALKTQGRYRELGLLGPDQLLPGETDE